MRRVKQVVCNRCGNSMRKHEYLARVEYDTGDPDTTSFSDYTVYQCNNMVCTNRVYLVEPYSGPHPG